MAVIFLLSAMQGSGSGQTAKAVLDWLAEHFFDLRTVFGDHALYVLRKSAHFTEFFILALLVHYASLRSGKSRRWFAWGFASLYAVTDEVHQLFVPNRVGAFTDVLIDASGAAMAIGVIWAAGRLLGRKNK